MYVIVVTQALVHCLICTHDAEGDVAILVELHVKCSSLALLIILYREASKLIYCTGMVHWHIN